MTALNKYQRLEATGFWRPSPDAERRDVVVSLGDASLTIMDTRDRILTHWSLAAVARVNKGALPALYHPDGDPDETLEIPASETDMIDALDRVHRAIERRRPRRGKLRGWVTGSIAGLVVLLAVFWLPGALLRHTVEVVPMVKRVEIGEALLERITRVAGPACTAPQAQEALRRLSARILGEERRDALVVVRDGVRTTLHLPGGRILLNRALVERPEDPDVTAGYVLVESLRRQGRDPLEGLLHHAGLWASLKLLTTGSLPESVLEDYAQTLMAEDPPAEPLARMVEAFGAADLRTTPYAEDLADDTTPALIAADPHKSDDSRPVLTDADWVRLQGICGG
ncbi:hypothetical protein P775_22960 [Puniceibacterium antarcticum]|uniref:Peptidase M48 domain-containing protein n=1 Tax=Puniceibacterium antarcticum TaxID=1206336 RepID=A0A2G8R8D3_9RHOB|nr:hypothetical protein [Puniceibacterium antarcticum]PIL17815.1 hypothetical protein P775_22960 [Puniceibacterium antarcticum]